MTSSSDNDVMLTAYFHYIPDQNLTITASCFFALLILWSGYAAWKSKYPLTYVVTLTAAAEFVGFIFRLICEWNVNLSNYIATTLLILMAPNLLALYNYIIVGRILDTQTKNQTQEALEEQSQQYKEQKWKWTIPIIQDKVTGLYNANKISYFFFIADIVSFGMQGIAGGMMSQASSANLGARVYQISLIIQLLFFATFTYVTYQASSLKYYKESIGITPDNQSTLFNVLFSTIALLTTRNIYRLIEFSEGLDGYLARHEPFFYAFDAALMIACIFLYCLYPAGECFAASSSSSSKDSTKAAIIATSTSTPREIVVKTVAEKNNGNGELERSIELGEIV